MFSKTLTATLAAAATALSAGASVFETNDQQRANLETVAGWGGATERGLRLDREKGEVVVLAEFCGIDPNATVEFPIVGELSDRDYEALFRTFAKPGSIGRAIEALGVRRGRNVSFATTDFWPFGERVAIDVAPFGATNGVWTPIQRYIIDMTTRAPLAFPSFVYCGSADARDGAPGDRLCDVVAPNSVFSTYNEPQTLIDMPARCGQSDVYERFLLAPDHGLAPFGLYAIRFRPAKAVPGVKAPGLVELGLSVGKSGDAVAYSLSGGGAAGETLDAAGLAARLKALSAAGNDLFASVGFDGSLTVAEAAAQAEFISKIDGEGGLRVRGPGARDIYYKGFLPSEGWRSREDRPSQPWEMRFAEGTNGVAEITLVKTIEDWTSTDSLDPILSTEEYKAASPEEALAVTAAHGEGLPVLLVFAPKTMALARIMPAVLALKPAHPTVYVFGE